MTIRAHKLSEWKAYKAEFERRKQFWRDFFAADSRAWEALTEHFLAPPRDKA